jgi:hypothetical protein
MSIPDLTVIVESVGIDTTQGTKTDFWPEEEDLTVHVVDHESNSRVRILLENT